MSKLKARIDKAVAGDLGTELASFQTTLKEIAECPDRTDALILAFTVGDYVYYDVVPVWRYVNGMRRKIPKFQSRPVIEDRLTRAVYQRYYTLGNGVLTPLKVGKPNDLRVKLPYQIGDDPSYQTSIVVPEEAMGLRKKSLLFHRRRPNYGG